MSSLVFFLNFEFTDPLLTCFFWDSSFKNFDPHPAKWWVHNSVLNPKHSIPILKSSVLVSMRIQIQLQLFTSIWIQIQGAKPMRVRLCRHKKLDFLNIPTSFWKTGNQVYLLLLVNLYTPWSGSRSAFLIRIRIRIQDSQINADPNPEYCLNRFLW